MIKEYDTFVDSLSELVEGQEIDLACRELTPDSRKKRYKTVYVLARVSSSPDKMPGADKLWVRFSMGMLHPKPWAIKIIKELGDYKHIPVPQGKRT